MHTELMDLDTTQSKEGAWVQEVTARGQSEALPFDAVQAQCIGGDMGEGVEDFCVHEIEAYSPCGQGEHVYLYIEKRGKTTLDLLRAIEHAFGVKEADIGYAGMKDKHAITRQWFSIRYGQDPSAAVSNLSEQQYTVLQSTRHSNKIRTGHLSANRFIVRLYGVQASDSAISERCASLSEGGFINYFGKQRFGYAGGNVALGLAALKGERRLKHKELKLMVSAVQSAAFNLCAGLRFERHGRKIFDGDVMQRRGGGCFVSTEPELDQDRVSSGEIVLTLPLPGNKVMLGGGVGHELEKHCAGLLGLSWPAAQAGEVSFEKMGKMAQGCRRAMWELPKDLEWERLGPSSICVSFSLSSGSYATVFLRQLCGKDFAR